MRTRTFLAILVLVCGMFAGGCSTTQDRRGSERVCTVHQVEMATKTVPIEYGLFDYPRGYLEARKTEFPNARTRVEGGCVIGNMNDAIVRSCPVCEQAELDWKESHKKAARTDAAAPIAPAPLPIPATPVATPTPEPTTIDLRPRLLALNLPPRPQGPRGTCSIFTTCEAIEYALALHTGRPARLSPEYLNWAASQAAGAPSDGNFFHNALNGFDRFGICTEDSMPYQPTYDAKREPTPEARAEAARLREGCRAAKPNTSEVAVHWIVPWQTARFGVSDEQFAEIKHVLARGYPVAAGSGHSRLLVGYRDDAAAPGGGKFITEDSALSRFDEVTYDFVRKQVADVFWIEAVNAAK